MVTGFCRIRFGLSEHQVYRGIRVSEDVSRDLVIQGFVGQVRFQIGSHAFLVEPSDASGRLGRGKIPMRIVRISGESPEIDIIVRVRAYAGGYGVFNGIVQKNNAG